MEQLLGYAFTGTVAVILWNVFQYFIKRKHLKTDRKTNEKISILNEVLDKVIDIRSEISFFLHQNSKIAFALLSEESKNVESISNFNKTISEKVDVLSKSLEIKANHLITINLKTLDIKNIIISTKNKLPYLIRKHNMIRVTEDNLNINLNNINEILGCAYELEDMISRQLRKL